MKRFTDLGGRLTVLEIWARELAEKQACGQCSWDREFDCPPGCGENVAIAAEGLYDELRANFIAIGDRIRRSRNRLFHLNYQADEVRWLLADADYEPASWSDADIPF